MSEVGRNVTPLQFIWHHLTARFDLPHADLSGKTILVTGGNAGLGFATVLHAAKANPARIIIASRSRANSEKASKEVYRQVPSFKGRIDVKELDLASFASVRAFCDEINHDAGGLDIVVANAGMINSSFKKTGDGHEQVLQVNALSTGLMCTLLLPKLSKGKDPHLCIVASEVHYWAKFPQHSAPSLLSALNDPKQYMDGSERYNVSKLLDIYLAREIAKLPAAQGVVVNSVNPGLCKSGFRDDWGSVVAYLVNLVSWTAAFGSRSIFYAATQPTAPGAYVSAAKETPPSSFIFTADGRRAQGKFWEECNALWGRNN